MRRCLVRVVVTVSVAVGCLLSFNSAAAATYRQAVSVTATTCVTSLESWRARSGRTVFIVRNATRNDYFFVQIVAQDSATMNLRYGLLVGKVYGQLDVLAPGTSAQLDATLPPGAYFFRCLDRHGVVNWGPGKVSGPPLADAHFYAPLAANQLSLAMAAYRLEVAPVLKRLGADTDRLAAAVREGRLADARTLWLPAHLDYAELGVAYGTFGSLDTEIDGRPFGLPLGVRDPNFRGFLRLEYGLWHGQSQTHLRPVAAALDQAVHTLLERTRSPKLLWTNSDLPLRAHEILENTLQFELTGSTNEGSGTNLATAWANAKGTVLALVALRPLLQHERDPALIGKALAGTRRLVAGLARFRRPSGGWRPLASLSTRERERIDSATSSLLETLERVPGELQSWPSRPVAGSVDGS